MQQYLLSVYQPDGPPPPSVDLAAISARLTTLTDEMRAVGAWVFTGRLHFADSATTLRPKDGDVLVTDGPFTEGKEHLGGFDIIRAADLDAALEWGRRLSVASGLPIEVRPFLDDY
jgi:hypothetical protein